MGTTQSCKVLVVSDFPSWELVTSNMLKWGGRGSDQVQFVDSGIRALTLAQADQVDLIIYYLWKFDLTGYEFCQRLNTIPALGRLPALLEGSVSPQLIYPEARRVGAAGYLRQPFEPEDLVAARDVVLRGGTFFPTEPERPKQWESATDQKGCRVLTCGYDPDLADLMQIILGQGRNDELRYVPDAPQLLIAAEQDPPDLIILPVMMPYMDGWETCKRLRTIPKLAKIPVLFCATMHGKEFHIRAQQVGGQGYLQLPFGKQELLAARDALLRGMSYYPAL